MKGRHRHYGPVNEFLDRAGGAIAAVAALVAAFAISGLHPPAPHRPFPVSSGPIAVTIAASRQASAIKVGQGIYVSQATWIVLTVRVTAVKEPLLIGHATLLDRAGNSYLASRRIGQPLIDGSRLLQPGITLETDIAFEVPRHALRQLTAEFAPQAGVALGTMLQIPVPWAGPVKLAPPQTELAPATVKPETAAKPEAAVKP